MRKAKYVLVGLLLMAAFVGAQELGDAYRDDIPHWVNDVAFVFLVGGGLGLLFYKITVWSEEEDRKEKRDARRTTAD